MYISQLLKSIVRWLLGNGKWYQLHLRSRWNYQFSNECKNFDKGIIKTVKTVYERENPSLSEEQGIGRFHDRLFGNWCHNHATSTKKRHFNGIDKMASNMTEHKRLVYKLNIFFGWIFIETLIHRVTYKDVSHFSKLIYLKFSCEL